MPRGRMPVKRHGDDEADKPMASDRPHLQREGRRVNLQPRVPALKTNVRFRPRGRRLVQYALVRLILHIQMLAGGGHPWRKTLTFALRPRKRVLVGGRGSNALMPVEVNRQWHFDGFHVEES